MKNVRPPTAEEIATILHDDLCQRLAGLNFRMAALDHKLAARRAAEAEEAKAIGAELQRTSASVRRLMRQLRGDPQQGKTK